VDDVADDLLTGTLRTSELAAGREEAAG
jgi:hypothetical protein